MSDQPRIKVALCLSGIPRFFSSASYHSLKTLVINAYQTDVFIHAWVSEDPNHQYAAAPWSGVDTDMKLPSSTAQEIIQLYQPKKYRFEAPRNFSKFESANYVSKNAPSMFYSLEQADRLRQEYEQEEKASYDWVVRARFDTLLGSLLELEEVADKTALYVPANCPNPEVCNDNFSFCTPEIASKAYAVYSTIESMYEEDEKALLELLSTPPEHLWVKHLERNSIPINRVKIFQSFIRGWDDRYDPFNLYPT